MDITLKSAPRHGTVAVPSSKSQAHRLLICAALSSSETQINCGEISNDIAATISCLSALCADIKEAQSGQLTVTAKLTDNAVKELNCAQSGSTLRFLLPICGALGKSAVFKMDGRLPERPLSPFSDVLCSMGMSIRREGNFLYCSGKLKSGDYKLPGDISSQFVSGLLFALPLLNESSTLNVTGSIESASYIAMTEQTLRQSGISFTNQGGKYIIPGGQKYSPPPVCTVEGDCSSAAFFLCMGAMSELGVTVKNFPENTFHGDRQIVDILRRFGADVLVHGDSVTVKKSSLHGCTVDARHIPDLVPVISVLACYAQGQTRITNASRLRLKESDRLHSITDMLTALGGNVHELEDGLIIEGTGTLHGGTVESYNDHRIAMSAAVAACFADGDITICNSECTNKSFPRFWDTFEQLEMTK